MFHSTIDKEDSKKENNKKKSTYPTAVRHLDILPVETVNPTNLDHACAGLSLCAQLKRQKRNITFIEIND